MKRAESHVTGATSAKFDKVADNFYNVCGIKYFSYSFVINSLHEVRDKDYGKSSSLY